MLLLLLGSAVILVCRTYYFYTNLDFVTLAGHAQPQIFKQSKYFVIADLNTILCTQFVVRYIVYLYTKLHITRHNQNIRECMQVIMYSACYFCHVLTNLNFLKDTLVKPPKYTTLRKYVHQKPHYSMWTKRQTDRHGTSIQNFGKYT